MVVVLIIKEHEQLSMLVVDLMTYRTAVVPVMVRFGDTTKNAQRREPADNSKKSSISIARVLRRY